jgi:predicted CoA-binding protein
MTVTTDWRDPEVARRILNGFHTWAVVGCSPKPWRASHGVARYLASVGFDVVPVHPRQQEVLGRRCYPDLLTAAAELAAEGRQIEVVDLFRNPEQVMAHVDEAIAIGAKAVWMQLEVWNPAAAERAADAGLLVVMDRCPAIDGPAMLG